MTISNAVHLRTSTTRLIKGNGMFIRLYFTRLYRFFRYRTVAFRLPRGQTSRTITYTNNIRDPSFPTKNGTINNTNVNINATTTTNMRRRLRVTRGRLQRNKFGIHDTNRGFRLFVQGFRSIKGQRRLRRNPTRRITIQPRKRTRIQIGTSSDANFTYNNGNHGINMTRKTIRR